MQCNTNYTGSKDNFDFLNILALEEFKTNFPQAVLGLSDHSPGHISVLGAVALGARVIEKHFTDDASRSGPDHGFALTPSVWRQMVDEVRNAREALGKPIKVIEQNEHETFQIQRRSLCSTRKITKGETLCVDDIVALRPFVDGAYHPFQYNELIGKRVLKTLVPGIPIRSSDLE